MPDVELRAGQVWAREADGRESYETHGDSNRVLKVIDSINGDRLSYHYEGAVGVRGGYTVSAGHFRDYIDRYRYILLEVRCPP